MPEVEKLKYKNVERYDSVAVLAYKIWPLCTLDAVQKFKEFSKEGIWTDWITGWINITTGCSISTKIQVFIG